MSYRALYTQEAAKQIRGLDKSVKKRVEQAILRLCSQPESGKRLKGVLAGRWSYRVGDWRILYKIQKYELLILILTVGHRREVYR